MSPGRPLLRGGRSARQALAHRARAARTLPEQNLGPIDAKLTDQGGYWGTDTLRLPLPDTWTMRLTVRTTDIDQVTVTKTIKIA